MQPIIRKAKRANIESLSHAGAAVRLAAVRSIRSRRGPSEPGRPPHTHTRRLPRAIKYAVDKVRQMVAIGPEFQSLSNAAKAHEHGGRFRGTYYPKRPFMAPALEKIKERLPKFWSASIR